MNFKEFKLKEQILKQIKAVGYIDATPIQEKAIPAILEGKDILGLAKTGTGKTAAFVIPMLEKLLETRSKGIRALIIAPTRELAEQINSTVKQLGENTGLKSVAVYGGVSSKTQINAIHKGADIVVGCPGRILDLINQKQLSLSKLEILVLDEADHMLDMGFLKDIEKIIKETPKNKQTLFFSATMPSEIREFASKVLRSPIVVEIEYKDPVKLIEHSLYHIETMNKKNKVFDLLENKELESIIIFMNSKHKAKNLSKALSDKGHAAVNFQGNLSQGQRDKALEGFRTAQYKILVATDIAARGLDIPQVTHVINYDLPRTAEAFTHRSGRTGRANKSGKVISFADYEDKKILRDILKVNKIKFENVFGEEIIPSNTDKKTEKKPERRPERRPEKKKNEIKQDTKDVRRDPKKEGNKEKDTKKSNSPKKWIKNKTNDSKKKSEQK
ncbi:MAG: DEAD/DEAH box helicase [Fusobacteriaceae bacterium]